MCNLPHSHPTQVMGVQPPPLRLRLLPSQRTASRRETREAAVSVCVDGVCPEAAGETEADGEDTGHACFQLF